MTAEESNFDVVVIGAGPGGYPAAIRASQRGARVALIEKETVGGTCLNRGCIPTKAILASSEVLDRAREAKEFGIKIQGAEPDWPAIIARKNRITETLTGGVLQLLKANGVTFIHGTASLTKDRNISVDTGDGTLELTAGNIIIATGSDPAELPMFDFSRTSVMTSTDGLELKTVPSSLIIVGSGVIGSEFATVFSSLGTKITMVELMDRILPTEDSRVSRQMKSVLRKRGIEILTKTTVEKVLEYREDGIKVQLSSGDTLEANKLLISIGRKLNSTGLGLEEAGVEVDNRGTINVNDRMETSADGIYAVGDVIGGILLAHTATAEGLTAAENATGGSKSLDESIVPACIFTNPEISSVGLNPDKAEEQGIEFDVSRFQLGGLGKALAMGEDLGFVQLVIDSKNHRLLGAQIMGPHASDLIQSVAIAMKMKATTEDIANTIHAHPSLPEAILEAAEAALGQAIHVAPAKKK